jgi:hypothetical protein
VFVCVVVAVVVGHRSGAPSQKSCVKSNILPYYYFGVHRVFMPHGIAHFLGLDVHDVSGCGPVPKELAVGHVITCEPGLYFIKPLLSNAAANTDMVSHQISPSPLFTVTAFFKGHMTL